MIFDLIPPLKFEIPDEWWKESNAGSFVKKKDYYAYDESNTEIKLIDFTKIIPPVRSPDIILDFNGFRKFGSVGKEDNKCGGMVGVLAAIVCDIQLPPVEIDKCCNDHFIFKINDGYHRFYASKAIGLTLLPCIIIETFSPGFQ